MSEMLSGCDSIQKVTSEETLSGVPLKGMDEVKEALLVFAMGKTRMSRANVQHEIGELSGSNVGSFRVLIPDPVAPSLTRESNEKIVDGVLNDLKSELAEYGKGSTSYNHHRLDAFTRTYVALSAFPNDLYFLELRGYIGGKQLEDGLAEYLGVSDEDRGLYDLTTTIEYTQRSQSFNIDFGDVVQRLASACNLSRIELVNVKALTRKERLLNSLARRSQSKITGKTIVGRIMADTNCFSTVWGSNEFEIARADNLQIGLRLGTVGERFDYEGYRRIPGSEDKFTGNGSILSGPLLKEYNGTEYISPSVAMFVREPFAGWEGWRKPTSNKDIRQRMREVNASIIEAFTSK